MSYRRVRWQKASARDSSGNTPSVLRSSGGTFDLDAKRDTLRQFEERMSAPGFWGDQQSAQGVVQQVNREIRVEALPTAIPEHIEVDMAPLEVGAILRVVDLPAIEGVTYLDDPETVLANCSMPRGIAELEEAEAAEGEEGEEGEAGETAEGEPSAESSDGGSESGTE